MADSDKTGNGRPVLVTGSIRSGTTWAGYMLAMGRELQYISEPLNYWRRPGLVPEQLLHPYTYICRDNEADFLSAFHRMASTNRWLPPCNLGVVTQPTDILRVARDLRDFGVGTWKRQRPLFKDPYALFSAGWFAERLNCQVVIVQRHPLPLVSSLKRMRGTIEMRHLLAQPLLMRDWLEPYREEMEACEAADPNDVVGQASLLWKLQYDVALQLCEQYPAFITVGHEDLSMQPLSGFETLYGELGLTFSEHARDGIEAATTSDNPSELPQGDPHKVKLDSKANLKNWRHRLEDEDIDRVMAITGEIRQRLYGDEIPG